MKMKIDILNYAVWRAAARRRRQRPPGVSQLHGGVHRAAPAPGAEPFERVRDRHQASFEVLITAQPAGGGGVAYRVTLFRREHGARRPSGGGVSRGVARWGASAAVPVRDRDAA